MDENQTGIQQYNMQTCYEVITDSASNNDTSTSPFVSLEQHTHLDTALDDYTKPLAISTSKMKSKFV